MIIGFGYKMRTGKDTSADYLIEKYGFKKISFAEALKSEVGEYNRLLINYNIDKKELYLYDNPGNMKLIVDSKIKEVFVDYILENKDCVDYITGDIIFQKYGRPKKDRVLLQLWGTNYRRVENENYWVDLVKQQILGEPDTNWVITDVRFPNELELIKQLGGVSVEIVRDVVGNGIPKHDSETALDDAIFDFHLQNDLEIVDLYKKLDVLMSYLESIEIEQENSAGE